jgi:hypothetical protein
MTALFLEGWFISCSESLDRIDQSRAAKDASNFSKRSFQEIESPEMH